MHKRNETVNRAALALHSCKGCKESDRESGEREGGGRECSFHFAGV
jgi:hypothetical protein